MRGIRGWNRPRRSPRDGQRGSWFPRPSVSVSCLRERSEIGGERGKEERSRNKRRRRRRRRWRKEIKDGARRRNSSQSGKERSRVVLKRPLSSRIAGCVSDGRFICCNPVYETLDAWCVCMYCMYARLLFCQYTVRMDRKRPGLNAPGIGLRAFCVVAAAPWRRRLRHGFANATRAWFISPSTLRRYPGYKKSEIIPQDPNSTTDRFEVVRLKWRIHRKISSVRLDFSDEWYKYYRCTLNLSKKLFYFIYRQLIFPVV